MSKFTVCCRFFCVMFLVVFLDFMITGIVDGSLNPFGSARLIMSAIAALISALALWIGLKLDEIDKAWRESWEEYDGYLDAMN